jgi:4-hydroxybutyrate dehydrogenase
MATLTYSNTCFFDFGAIKRLPKALKSLNVTRPVVVTDKGLVAAGLAGQVAEILTDGGLPPAAVFDDTPANPTEAAVTASVGLVNESGSDGIVALGGGSSIDLGKATALMAKGTKPLVDHAGIVRGKALPTLPLIAVPTTAGTGSEVSNGFIIIVEDGRKLTFVSDVFTPDIAICDPELTLGLPAGLTAATGMDAVTHCIEAVLSPAVNPPAEAIGLDGLSRTIGAGHLINAVADGDDRKARWQMMMASTEGAYAFVKGLGAVHAMSHACGALPGLSLHHGMLNAVLLPPVLNFNAAAAPDKMARIAAAMGLGEGKNASATADAVAKAIIGLNRRFGLPADLAEMGVNDHHLPRLIRDATADMASITNPRPVSESDYEALFSGSLRSGVPVSV